MKRERVINHSLHPEMLESGVQLAAAGTPGAVREDVTLTAADRKRLAGRVTVIALEGTDAAGEETPARAKTSPRKSD